MSIHKEHKGFEIHGHAEMSAGRYVPAVTLTHPSGDTIADINLRPPCGKGFSIEMEAERAALDYGVHAVDCIVGGSDPHS